MTNSAEPSFGFASRASDTDATWIVEATAPPRRRCVLHLDEVVPNVFERYACVFHPAYRIDAEKGSMVVVRWLEFAESLQIDTALPIDLDVIAASTGPSWDEAPRTGTMEREDAAELESLMAAHTETPNDCFFRFSEGFMLTHGEEGSIFRGHLVGPLAAARSKVARCTATQWWPQDRAWLVVSHVDLPFTLVGGTSASVRAILDSTQLETSEPHAGDPIATARPVKKRRLRPTEIREA